MLRFNFKAAFAARGIFNVYGALTSAGFTEKVARNIALGKSSTLMLKHLEIICRMLNCTPNDLITYEPSSDKPLPEGHQLNRLAAIDLNHMSSQLRNLSFEQINEMTRLVTQGKS